MSEPIKNPNHTPESYSPTKPEILSMAEQKTREEIDNMITNHIVEMIGIEYIHLPAMRFIGMEVIAKGKKAGEKYGNMWGKSPEFMPILDQMSEYTTIITDPCGFMHHNDLQANTQMYYLVGKFMKAGTPVPEGFQYRDIPESDVGIATFYGEFNDMISKMYVATRDKILGDGKGIPYPVGYFHAEVYIKECDPNPGKISKLSYLFSCKGDK